MIRDLNEFNYDDYMFDYVVVNVFGAGSGVGLVDVEANTVELMELGPVQVELVEV